MPDCRLSVAGSEWSRVRLRAANARQPRAGNHDLGDGRPRYRTACGRTRHQPNFAKAFVQSSVAAGRSGSAGEERVLAIAYQAMTTGWAGRSRVKDLMQINSSRSEPTILGGRGRPRFPPIPRSLAGTPAVPRPGCSFWHRHIISDVDILRRKVHRCCLEMTGLD